MFKQKIRRLFDNTVDVIFGLILLFLIIVFIIRELLIGFFKHDIKPDLLIAITILLFVLGMIRISSVLVYQREKTMISEIESEPRH